ncbi:MAG: putative DNA binding domain-containing protein [Bacilli bacterium]|nr:putative DNA binding domain-containing protein [Bacilli bacterium]
MQEKELINLINNIISLETETKNIEFKKAKDGVPENLYDTFSSFSNTSGGIIIFGVDEKNNYNVSGISNPDILQKKVAEQSLLMEPKIRPIITICEYKGKIIASAEIPELDVFNKPCYYSGKGKMKGSYIRVGDADLPMTDYEIYSFDAFKYKTEDELRFKERIDSDIFNDIAINAYLDKLLSLKPNLVNLDKNTILKMNGIIDKNNLPTICGIMNFGKYPQIFSPNLDIVAVKCACNEYGVADCNDVRFLDNKRLDGTISEMLKLALSFVISNIKKATRVNEYGIREDIFEYPIKALREIILNALIHRDYSIHTENDPIRLIIYDDRIEITNPGGLYGRLSIDDLGKVRSDIRNPFIASILEILEVTENRYSGIPTIYAEMKKAGLMEPVFENLRGTFKVTLYNSKKKELLNDDFVSKIKSYCKTPRTKESLAKFFGYDDKHPAYFINSYVIPLIDQGILGYTLPNKPRSKNQKIYTIE